MDIFTRGLLLITIAVIIDIGYSQNALKPLWPCYSVHKMTIKNNASPSSEYRYVSKLVTAEGEVHNPEDPDCVFTLEGPPNTRLELQLFNVVIQRPGYVSTSSSDTGNCTIGAVRIYNFTVTGALILITEACNSFQTGTKLLSDTNVAVITSTIARGHFDLTVTIVPENATENSIRRIFPRRNGNVIILGHTQEEVNAVSKLLEPVPTNDSPPNKLPGNSSAEDNYDDSDYYDYVNSNDILNDQFNKLENNNVNYKENLLMRPIEYQVIQDRNDQVNPHHQGNNLVSGDFQQNNLLNQEHRNKLQNGKTRQSINYVVRNQHAQQNAKLNQPANRPVGNEQQHSQLSEIQKGQLGHLVNQPAENNFINQNNQLRQQINNRIQNQINQQQAGQLSQLQNVVRSQLAQQNGQLDQPLNEPLLTQFVQPLNQHTLSANQQLLSQFKQQQNSVPESVKIQIIDTKTPVHSSNNQLKQYSDQINQLLNQLTPSQLQLLLDQVNKLIFPTNNLFNEQKQNGQSNHLTNQLLQTVQQKISQLIEQINNQKNQLVNIGNNQLSEQQNAGTNHQMNQFNLLKGTTFSQQNNQPSQQDIQVNKLLMELINSMKNNQFTLQTNDELNQAMSTVIQNNHSLLHLIRNQVLDQNEDQKNALINITSNGNTAQRIVMLTNNDQFNNVKNNDFQQAGNEVIDSIFSNVTGKPNELMDNRVLYISDNNPNGNSLNTVMNNQSIYRENSKFANPEKTPFPQDPDEISDHMLSQSNIQTIILENGNKTNFTHISHASENEFAMFPDPQLNLGNTP